MSNGPSFPPRRAWRWRISGGPKIDFHRRTHCAEPGHCRFEWEGFDIDTCPSASAEIETREYLELRSLFLWLASADNLSPFQSDLRN